MINSTQKILSPTPIISIESSQPPNFLLHWTTRKTNFPEHKTTSTLLVATDGSYLTPYNKSAFVMATQDGYILLSGSRSPITYKELLSSYDAEIHAVSLACETFLWLQGIVDWKSITVKFHIDNQAVIKGLTNILEGKPLSPLIFEYEKWYHIYIMITQLSSRILMFCKK